MKGGDVQRIAQALESLHFRRNGPDSHPASATGNDLGPGGSPGENDPERWYRKLSALFSSYGNLLEEHEKMVDAHFGKSGPGASMPNQFAVQREIRIHCPADGRSGARFTLENPSAAVRSLRIVPGWFSIPGTGRNIPAASLAVNPREVAVEPGGDLRVSVEVDLAGSGARRGDNLEGFLDVRGDENQLIFRIWIVVNAGIPETEGNGP